MSVEGVELVERFPSVDDYRRMRLLAGLSEKAEAASIRSLPNTTYGVSLLLYEKYGFAQSAKSVGMFYRIAPAPPT